MIEQMIADDLILQSYRCVGFISINYSVDY
jgi:hypothetical protein